MERYTQTLNQTDQFTEITENLNDADHCAKLPDLRALCAPLAPYAAFRACCPPSVERHSLATELNQYVDEFIEMGRRVAPFPYAAESCEPYLVGWLACAYTVEALEMQLRATGKPLKGHMSIRQTSGLRGLLRTGGILSVCATSHVAAKLAVHLRSLLNTVFVGDTTAVTAMDDDACASASVSSTMATSVVAYDVFKMLASLVFMMPAVLYVKANECAVPNGQLNEFYLVQLMHVANVVKVLLLHAELPTPKPTPDSSMEIDVEPHNVSTEYRDISPNGTVEGYQSNETIETGDAAAVAAVDVSVESDPLVAFYHKYNLHVIGGKSNITRARLDQVIATDCATFLRCTTLLFNTITDVPMPDELAVLSTDGKEADKYAVMCAYLGLNPDAGAYLTATNNEDNTEAASVDTSATTYRFAVRLAEHRSHAQLRASAPPSVAASVARQFIVPCVTPISAFVELPEDYSDLINSVSQYTCPNNVRDDTRNPTMCLICGAILCSMTYCCQVEVNGATVGACTAHTISCGAGVGAFLRIRDCEVLLLGFNKGCFVSAPYLDEYGETDQGLRRGNALRLCPERLRKLHMMWLTHCMHEDIARLAESNNSMIQTQWQNM